MWHRNRLTETSRLVVRTAFIVNRVFFLAVAVGLLWSLVLPGQFAHLFEPAAPTVDLSSITTGLRLTLLIGIVMAVATDRLLVALGQVIATARQGDPFIAANAGRLRSIGWSLLVLQLLDVPGAVLARFFPDLSSSAPSDGFSVGGWIAVLMVFVLAQVFAAGSAMRDDIAATV